MHGKFLLFCTTGMSYDLYLYSHQACGRLTRGCVSFYALRLRLCPSCQTEKLKNCFLIYYSLILNPHDLFFCSFVTKDELWNLYPNAGNLIDSLPASLQEGVFKQDACYKPEAEKFLSLKKEKSRDFYISNMRKHTSIRQLVSSIFKIGGTLKHFLVNAQSFLQSCKGQFRTKMMGCRRVNTATRWSCQNAQYVVQSMGCPHPLSEISLPRLQFKICRWASLSLKQFQRYKWMVFKSWQWNLVSFGRNIRQGFEIYNNPGCIVFPSLSSIRVRIVFN